MNFLRFSILCLGLTTIPTVTAQSVAENTEKDVIKNSDLEPEKEKSSSWLLSPTFSSDPKISTSIGALVAYVYQIDNRSPASTFGGTAGYSSSDSYYYGLFARTYFGEDYHRLTAAAFQTKINNEYDDYLGTGLPAKTQDDASIAVLRYQYQVADNWYFGFQGVSSDYVINPGDVLSGIIIDYFGLSGFKSNGLGLLLNYDTRDNQNSPMSGVHFEANNLAYREAFGGDVSFDVYTLSGQYYFTKNERYTTAINAKGRWTSDATAAGYSSVELRGYVRGQYLRPHMSMIEIEERIHLYKKLGMSVFSGVAVLYGSEADGSGDDLFFPAGGAGLTYQLNDDKMTIRAEFAIGKEDNYGFYLKFGQPF